MESLLLSSDEPVSESAFVPFVLSGFVNGLSHWFVREWEPAGGVFGCIFHGCVPFVFNLCELFSYLIFYRIVCCVISLVSIETE